MPKRRIEECAARRQARVDRGEDVIVGVNKYRLEQEDELDILDIDNTAVRGAQIERLRQVRATRDAEAVRVALAELSGLARASEGNLLEAAIRCARARASVGEISSALEDEFTRYRASTSSISGVYRAAAEGDEEYEAARRDVLVKLGQDGHDRGMKVVATAFADVGFDVDIGPLFQIPEEAARQAIENDVHVVGVSTQAGGHKSLVPELVELLRAQGADDVCVVVGGIVPPQDYAFLRERGVAAILGPGTPIPRAAREVLEAIRSRRK
jgi:methylmalonyl-CoA mutase